MKQAEVASLCSSAHADPAGGAGPERRSRKAGATHHGADGRSAHRGGGAAGGEIDLDQPTAGAATAAAADPDADRYGAPAARGRRRGRRHLRDRSVRRVRRENIAEGAAKKVNAEVYAVQQIYVAPSHRFELKPYWGFTLNDQFVNHPGPGLAPTSTSRNVLAIGLNGNLYGASTPTRTSTSRIAARRAHRRAAERVPVERRLNFTYVPMYGKFAGFGRLHLPLRRLHRRRRRRHPHAAHPGHRSGQSQVRLRPRS